MPPKDITMELLDVIESQKATIAVQRETIALLKAANDKLEAECAEHARVNNDLIAEFDHLYGNVPGNTTLH